MVLNPNLWSAPQKTNTFFFFFYSCDMTYNQYVLVTHTWNLCSAIKPSNVHTHSVKSSHLYFYKALFCKALLTIQIVSKQLHNIKIWNHYWFQWCHPPAQFSLNSICAIKSVISLEMKCPQLSKPEATKTQNSIGDRTEKKTLGETRLSRGASSPPARRTSSLFQLQKSQCKSSAGSSGLSPMAV